MNSTGRRPDQDDSTPVEAPARAAFRPARLGYLFPIALAVFAIPAAFGAPWFWLVYVVPVGIVYWLARTRTVVDTEAVTVRRPFGSRRVPWESISSLRLQPATRSRGARVSAVLTSGGELPLPAVHVRDLSQLAAASGGRLPDPAGE
ncbi:PH domain-containing protein [Pseudonocardia sp. N23]|uniref:PH domain-containing protein n=1 Tax=Pseudonocardia sp. N23 TaxID=1987376 RepID=UPI001145515C|nr:PH domain-containing protein [Pseudonocardia sp. N23]